MKSKQVMQATHQSQFGVEVEHVVADGLELDVADVTDALARAIDLRAGGRIADGVMSEEATVFSNTIVAVEPLLVNFSWAGAARADSAADVRSTDFIGACQVEER